MDSSSCSLASASSRLAIVRGTVSAGLQDYEESFRKPKTEISRLAKLTFQSVKNLDPIKKQVYIAPKDSAARIKAMRTF